MAIEKQSVLDQKLKELDNLHQTDHIASELWSWSDKLEKVGKFLVILFLLGGACISSYHAYIVVDIGSLLVDAKKKFDIILFVTDYAGILLYAFLLFCSYKLISVVLGGLAGIYQNTKKNNALLELQIRNQLQITYPADMTIESSRSVSSNTYTGAAASDGWVCSKCGTKNGPSARSCKGCGEYK